MKKICSLLLVIAIISILCACGGESFADEYIGAWVLDANNSETTFMGMEKIELFNGGTGEGFDNMNNTNLVTPLIWEVKKDVLVITLELDSYSTSFEVEENKMTSSDGKVIFIKEVK